ncbi:hypothetical protein GX586_14150 [bacterium]|nr:hypothetical protein [bacterium]
MKTSKTIETVKAISIIELSKDAQKKLVGGIGIAPSGPSTRDTSINGDTQGFVIYE